MFLKNYNYTVDKSKIGSIHLILSELNRLNNYLDGTELHNLKFFNSVYIFVDRELELAVSSGIFSYPELVKQLDIAFSLYYFDALNYFVEHKKLPESWDVIIKKGIFSPFYFLLGANVHINHDLPLAILDSISNFKDFEKDFYKIDEVITRAIRKFFQTYKPTGIFATVKYVTASFFRKPVVFIILRWRHQSWHYAQLIATQKLTQLDLDKETDRISNKLILFGKFFNQI